jgi:hypothetical protein
MSAIAVGILTFLWYRKGRLWNYYDSLFNKCIDQIKKDSLDRKSWEQLVFDETKILSSELINSTFRFENEYLKHKIHENKHEFWIAEVEQDNEQIVVYTDKVKYCNYRFKQIFYDDFRFCGLILFINSVQFLYAGNDDRDKGYEIKKLDNKI